MSERREGGELADGGLPRRPIVRPYVLTGGRTTPRVGALELHTPVLALIAPEQLATSATPEDRRIVELCQVPMSIAELAARLAAPVGVVRVLVGDLVIAHLVAVREAGVQGEHVDVRMLERLLEGIRAL